MLQSAKGDKAITGAHIKKGITLPHSSILEDAIADGDQRIKEVSEFPLIAAMPALQNPLSPRIRCGLSILGGHSGSIWLDSLVGSPTSHYCTYGESACRLEFSARLLHSPLS